MNSPSSRHHPDTSRRRGAGPEGVTDSTRSLSNAGNSVIREPQDERVEVELVLELKRTAEPAFAGSVGGEIEEKFFSVCEGF
jgi:hypothetical protein